MFQHTAARRRLPKDGIFTATFEVVSTHSRPKAAANVKSITIRKWPGFNTQPPEGGCLCFHRLQVSTLLFQHTAARRRLPKRNSGADDGTRCFNTQPPEGGCRLHKPLICLSCRFNTQPPEGGCVLPPLIKLN